MRFMDWGWKIFNLFNLYASQNKKKLTSSTHYSLSTRPRFYSYDSRLNNPDKAWQALVFNGRVITKDFI